MLRALVQIALVLGLAAVLLWGVDRLPGVLLGLPRGARSARSLLEAESRLGVKVRVPEAFRAAVDWPPARIATLRRGGPALAMTTRSRESGRSLSIFWVWGPRVPESLRPAGQTLHVVPLKLAGRPASVRTCLDDGSRTLQDLEWAEEGLRVALRFEGPTLELIRLGESLAAEVP